MHRFPELAAYAATFGSMTAAALVVIALIILDGGGDADRYGRNGVRVVVAEQTIPAGTEISEQMVKLSDVPEEQVVPGAFSDAIHVVGQMTKVAIAAGEQVTDSKLAQRTQANSVPSH